jgi:outer membrane protein OmpA-like peptidoglycan-associated protein
MLICKKRNSVVIALVIALCFCSCSRKKMCLKKECLNKNEGLASGNLSGAVMGAGSGAITGFQLGSGTGPGVAVGAGLGAVAGGVRGIVHDINISEIEQTKAKLRDEKIRAEAQAVIASHMAYRLDAHPSREIYPADLFFSEDSDKLKPLGKALVGEIYLINKNRLPWSRFGVISYVKSSDMKSSYSKTLAEKRALAIANELVRSGIEPRRIAASAVVTKDFLIKDDNIYPGRYGQAVEFLPIDK